MKSLMFCARSCRHAVLAIVSLVVLMLGSGSTARAFSDPNFYLLETKQGGGGGRWFTGSPADGYDCAACHKGGHAFPLYVSGLPPLGYVPGTVYQIGLSWPEFAANDIAIRGTNPAAAPTMELVAELVAESGKGSGSLELKDLTLQSAAEKCARPAGKIAAEMWTVAPVQLSPANVRLECDASDVNERCLVSVKGCGAQQVNFTWTAPSDWQGNIWFSAGLVTSDDTTGEPNIKDGVTTLSIPLAPAASTSAGYVSRLESGCSVHNVGSFGSAGWLGLSCWLVVLRSLRRHQRKERS